MSFSIDRQSGLSRADFVANYAAKSLPVILTDATAHWPARKKWNFDYFESRFADKTVSLNGEACKIGDLIQKLRAGPVDGYSPYLSMAKLDEQFPELWADVGSLEVARHNRLKTKLLPNRMRINKGIVAVFVGTKGSGFRLLHWDSTKLNVFVSQILGDKNFVVFRPEDTPYLYPKNSLYDDNHSTLPDPFHVDLAQFPEFAKASPIYVTVKEGETLFLPAGWWHATNIDQPNIAIAESDLDAFNWRERGDWYQDKYKRGGSSFLKRHVLRHFMTAYLMGADLVLRAKERLL